MGGRRIFPQLLAKYLLAISIEGLNTFVTFCIREIACLLNKRLEIWNSVKIPIVIPQKNAHTPILWLPLNSIFVYYY